jgi:hypothetical protein
VEVKRLAVDHHFDHHCRLFGIVRRGPGQFQLRPELHKRLAADGLEPAADAGGKGSPTPLSSCVGTAPVPDQAAAARCHDRGQTVPFTVVRDGFSTSVVAGDLRRRTLADLREPLPAALAVW